MHQTKSGLQQMLKNLINLKNKNIKQ